MLTQQFPKMPAYLFALTILILLFPVHAWCGDAPRIGDNAREINLEALIQAPAGSTATLAELRGKVVVLEFWATWCAPCVADFPHLNKLTEVFEESGDVVFISITDEPREKIENFLKKHPLKAWVGIDKDRSAFSEYRVTGVPHAVIINKQGKIIAITHPAAISERVLRDVAAAKPVNLPPLPSLMAGAKPSDGDSFVIPDGLPGSIDEMNKFSLTQTVPGEEHKVLERLAGHWTIETALQPMMPGGSETKVSSTVSRTWILDGRVLQSHSIMNSNPHVEQFSMIGYDVDKDQYFMDEYSPLESAPKRWVGQWNEASSTLVFERAMEVRIMGGPASSAMQAGMTLVFDLGEKGKYKTKLSMTPPDMSEFLPPGATLGGNDSGKQLLSESVAKRNDQE